MFNKLLALQVTGPDGIPIDISAPHGIPAGGIWQLQNLFGTAWSVLFVLAIILCLFIVIWGGFNWITSGGDKQKLNQARQKIIFAVIGLVVVFLAVFVARSVVQFLGYSTGTPPCRSVPGHPSPC